MQRTTKLYRLLICAVLLALGMVLPFLTGQIPAIGQSISPLHIPVFIAGLCCGGWWGAALGVVLPLVRSAVFGMPPLVAVAIPMAFELAVYGGVCGVMYPLLRRCMKGKGTLLPKVLALLCAMLLGRLVGGAAKAVVMGITGGEFPLAMFISSYFVTTAPGAAIHLVLVPAVAAALERARLSPVQQSMAKDA